MAVTRRKEAERAVVRCALEAREAVLHRIDYDPMFEEKFATGEEHEALGALLAAIDTLRNLPTLGIDQPRPAVRDDAADTSRSAARRIAPKHGSKRRTIYDAIAWREYGLTDLELEELTGWPHQTVSAARNSLVGNGWLFDSGQRRVLNGRKSIVWFARAEEPNA